MAKKTEGAPQDGRERIRLNLVVNRRVKERLERLQELSEGASLTEVIRRALAVYDEMLSVRQEGGRVVIENGDEREVLRII